MDGVKNLIGLTIVYFFTVKCHNIGNSLARFVIVKSVNLFKIGGCDFRRIFADFDFGYNFSVFLNTDKLINSAEYRPASRSYQSFTDTKRVNLGTVGKSIADDVFIKRIRHYYTAIFKTFLVQFLADFLCQVGDVAAVDTNALRSVTGGENHFLKHFNSIGKTAFKNIVCIDKQRTAVGIHLGICLKGIVFRGEHLHPAVCHCAYCRDTVKLVA